MSALQSIHVPKIMRQMFRGLSNVPIRLLEQKLQNHVCSLTAYNQLYRRTFEAAIANLKGLVILVLRNSSTFRGNELLFLSFFPAES